MMHCLRAAGLRPCQVVASRNAVGNSQRAAFCAPRQSMNPFSRNVHSTVLRAGFSLADVQPEVLAGGAAALATVLGSVAWYASNATSGDQSSTATTTDNAADTTAVPRENAVLVFGATGRLGRLVVKELLASGRTVVAAVRSTDKAAAIFDTPDYEDALKTAGGALVVEQVDVTNAESLTADLFKGVSQVVISLGALFGRLPDGSMGIIDNMSSERVEAGGIPNIAAAAVAHIPKQQLQTTTILPMATEEDLTKWDRLDDVIMGGQSSSAITPSPDGSGATWRGDLIIEGGGFCGARTKKLDLDLSAYDGIHLRVKGDGQTFKMNIKTVDQEDIPESTYQATFDTDSSGAWTDVFLPWHNFVPVMRAQSVPGGPPLDAGRISKFGLVLSRFEFNKMPNPDYKPGPFELQIEGGFQAYRQPRSQIIMTSSAGVERNAIIGDDIERRKKDIPIVRLNPNGTLNHKYAAEAAVRASGLPYTVVRPTGMSDSAEEGPFLLEADQGDAISGVVTREEVARVVAAATQQPEAAGKTFELRRNAAVDAKGVEMGDKLLRRLFLKLALDKHRWRVGLEPFPKVVPPPAPPAEEEKQAVLNDPRVVATAAINNAARAADIDATAAKSKDNVVVGARN